MKHAHMFITAMTRKGLFSCQRGENLTNVNSLQKVTVNPDGTQKVITTANGIRSTIRETASAIIARECITDVSVNRSRVKNGDTIAVTYKGGTDSIHDPQEYLDDALMGYLEIETKKKEQRDSAIRMSNAISISDFYPENTLMHQSPQNTHELAKADKPQQLFSEECIYTAFQYSIDVSMLSLQNITKRDTMLRLFFQTLSELGHVGGNATRYYMEFQPVNAIIRSTNLGCGNIPEFTSDSDYQSVVNAIISGAINPTEVILAGSLFTNMPEDIKSSLEALGVRIYASVTTALDSISTETTGNGLYAR